MHKKPSNNNVHHITKRKTFWFRCKFKKQKGSISLRHKVTNIKATDIIKIAEREESAIEEDLFEVKRVREAKKKRRIRES